MCEPAGSPDVYGLARSSPRGFAFIVNIRRRRPGSEKDVALMTSLFSSMNYEVRIIEDQTKEVGKSFGVIKHDESVSCLLKRAQYFFGISFTQAVMSELKEVSTDSILESHDSIVLFFMAHGLKGRYAVIKAVTNPENWMRDPAGSVPDPDPDPLTHGVSFFN